MKIDYTLIRSGRKTVAVYVTEKLEVIVRAPLFLSSPQADKIVASAEGWIEKQLARQREKKASGAVLSPEQKQALRLAAQSFLPGRAAYFSGLMNAVPSGIKITSAEKRWGSCGPKNSICFSYRVMLLPKDAIDYIIVHELAHIRHKNHGPGFYAEISKYLPDYKRRIKLIKSADLSALSPL